MPFIFKTRGHSTQPVANLIYPRHYRLLEQDRIPGHHIIAPYEDDEEDRYIELARLLFGEKVHG